MLQIHQKKREVVKNVDAGEGVVELETIEKGRLSIEQTNVAEVKIAVAMAHFAGRSPAVEQLRHNCDLFLPFF